MAAATFLLVKPGTYSDLIGLAIFLAIFFFQYKKGKAAKASAAAA